MGQEIHICVGKDCTYGTITQALEAAKEHKETRVIIQVKNGIYKEKLVITQDNLTIIGESKENCLIEYNNYAEEILEDGEKRGTFRTSSVFIDCNNFTARNITIANTAGPGYLVGQGLALYIDGDCITFENCNIFGGQDTLFCGPLPEVEYIKGGFRGPKEHAPRVHGRHLFRKCYICGDIDFIFGSATSYFEYCDINSNNVGEDIVGYVCAPSTMKGKEGFVFNYCRFVSDCKKESVYLARPWRNDARVIIMNSYIGGHIKKEGFHDWDKVDARESVFFAEYNNHGCGAKFEDRVDFAKRLTAEEAHYYTRENVIGF